MLQRNNTGLLAPTPRQRNQRGTGDRWRSRAVTTARLLHDTFLLGNCISDPNTLIHLDCKWCFPNQPYTHCASGRRQEPLFLPRAQHRGVGTASFVSCAPALWIRDTHLPLKGHRHSASAAWEGICR